VCTLLSKGGPSHSLHTVRFFLAGLEERSKKFRPEAFSCILAATLEFISDALMTDWRGGVVQA